MKRAHDIIGSIVVRSFGIVGGVALAIAATPSCESSNDSLTITSSGGEAGQGGNDESGGSGGAAAASGEGGSETGGNGDEVGGNGAQTGTGGDAAGAGGEAGTGGNAEGEAAGTGGDAGGGGGSEQTCPPGFVLIPSGKFTMGSPPDEKGRYGDETLHEVTLTRAFCMQETEVTQAQYREVTKENPSIFSTCGDNCPVDSVNWHMATEYCNKLSATNNLDSCYICNKGTCSLAGNPYECKGYRLPTEAEWEYAARAGTQTAFYNGDITQTGCGPLDSNLDNIGWYCENSEVTGMKTPHPVKGKTPTTWNLYDMSGNVWEWCHDGYQVNLETKQVMDPVGPESVTYRVIRGGSWKKPARDSRSAKRTGKFITTKYEDLGFRPVVAPK